MSKKLADALLNAGSAESFLRERRRPLGWKDFAALKRQVDRLVHSDLNVAARLTDRIERLAELVEDPLATAFAQASRARLLHLLGQHARANEFYEGAIQQLLRARLAIEAATLRKQQIDTFTEMAQYKDALRVAHAARRVLAHDEPVQLAQLETNVGNIYYRLDRYQKALEHYNKARDLFATTGEPSMRALVALNTSNVFVEIDRPDEAVALLENAARTWSRIGQRVKAAQARSKIAYIKFLRGDYAAALAGYAQIREELSAVGGTELVTWCDLETAEIFLALNAFDDAAESAAQARSGFAGMGLPYESAQATVVCALAAMGAGRLDQAEDYLREAREMFARKGNANYVAQIDLYLAELALKRGDAPAAAASAGASLRLFNRQKLPTRSAYARLLIARAAYESKDHVEARRAARLALRSIANHYAPAIAYQCHHLLGKILRDKKQNREALQSFLVAIGIIEQLRSTVTADEFKATFLRDKIEVYEDAINACLDEGAEYLEDAFRLVESSKSRALAELLARYLRGRGRKALASSKAEDRTRARLLKLMEDLNWYSAQSLRENEKGGQRRIQVVDKYAREMERCERQIAQLFRRLEAADALVAEVQHLPAVGVTDLREALEEDETIIEYFTTGDQVSAFLARQSGVELARGIASKREVERLMSALRFQLEKFNYGAGFADEHFEQLHHAVNQHLIDLYEVTFAALEPRLESQRLVIIPHGALHYVPFHALLNRRGYLIDRYEISYAPSATVLNLCRAKWRESRRPAAAQGQNGKSKIQNPKSKMGLVALGLADSETPSIDAEIRALRNLFPDSVTLTGSEATRHNLMKMAPEARFLHLASHSYFRRDNPMFSFLKLADAPLNFYSLMDLRLRAELVTLSACHTGMNSVFPGDELHGLMRGFLYAGAPSLVASLWAANDLSTAEFMRVMYTRLGEGDTKRAALRAAQLAIKDAYGHPYYWAPFVLMGNPN